MVLMNEIVHEGVMTTSLHVMMDLAHTETHNATATTTALTEVTSIIATWRMKDAATMNSPVVTDA